MEEKSIFQTELSATSNGHILSAAKWSRFLGIVFIVLAGILLLACVGLAFFMQSGEMNDVFSQMAVTNPQFAMLENLPSSLFLVFMVVAIAFFIFMGILLINIGKHGTAYNSSNEDMAFVNTFKAAKTYFLISAIISIISILSTLISFF